ncbi:MAG: alpha/beta hydrolase [Ahrensia sp.]|nr:alpha/beta hydrolase [Ahrensia sp.]
MNQFDAQFVIESPTGTDTGTGTGAALNTYYKAPMGSKGRSRGIVHINHGLAEHAARYATFASVLSESGFHIYAHDHRGHGHTKVAGGDAPQGVFSLSGDGGNKNGMQKVLRDCAAVQDFALARHSNGDGEKPLPVIMFGHSMGGLITMNYALAHGDRLAGAAVWNANFDGGALGRLAQAILKFERFRLGSDVPSRLLPKLTFEAWGAQIKNRRTAFDWLSHIEGQVDAYIADPLCGWDASVGMWLTIFEMVFAGGKLGIDQATDAAKKLPFSFVGGGQDPATNKGASVRAQAARLQAAGFSQVALTIFDKARHETLNDHDAAAATALFDTFARACAKAHQKA